MRYLSFDLSDSGDGVATFEAWASTPQATHASVMAEVQAVLDWSAREFAGRHGPVDEGFDWDHELQIAVEAGGWHAVTLTLTGSPAFAQAFSAKFLENQD